MAGNSPWASCTSTTLMASDCSSILATVPSVRFIILLTPSVVGSAQAVQVVQPGRFFNELGNGIFFCVEVDAYQEHDQQGFDLEAQGRRPRHSQKESPKIGPRIPQHAFHVQVMR